MLPNRPAAYEPEPGFPYEPAHEQAPEPEAAPAQAPSPAGSPRPRGRRGWRSGAFVALALLGGFAVAKWLFGWLTVAIDADVPRLDDVQCTVFAPTVALTGSTILVQVFAHLPDAAADANAIATELDVEAVRRAFRSLDAPVPVGSRLDFELRLVGLEIDDPVASCCTS